MDKHSGIKTVKESRDMRAALLGWYDAAGRQLPWRIRPEDDARADPYAVWLSEIMLQQTTVAHATPYWKKFLARFPTVSDLARAQRDEVLAMWAGLGYYARARNLHKCAAVVTDEHGGAFPRTEAALLRLPGIGPYTAATIAAICFDEPTNIVDGNIERVISRIFALQSPLPKARSELRRLASTLTDPARLNITRPGDYGQALMDLGATVCHPRRPNCANCVWESHCAAHARGQAAEYPKKTPKKKIPLRRGVVFVLFCGTDVLLSRRPDKGLLGGMMGFPGTPWSQGQPETGMDTAPLARNWELCEDEVKHVFTHFELRLTVYRAHAPQAARRDTSIDGEWADLRQIKQYALPTVFSKVLRAAQK
jgi:A/G-specific adenine glycosylase